MNDAEPPAPIEPETVQDIIHVLSRFAHNISTSFNDWESEFSGCIDER